ncbi:unnamed protein product [Phytophthora fragariaefolia]|uniref:Unnamed protein product n=1 Tax=Phytophthora fragariaefolia TaxID=1490495 RepID=A0A9W6XZ97_9STRA|nr:unnamed protein product [Phytophthora fragariaefolia]
MIHLIVQATDHQIEPADIVCDYGAALNDSLQMQFPNAIVIGSHFTMKLTLRRAMKHYAIPEDKCLIAMPRGLLDTQAAANVVYSAEKRRKVWSYFERTWLGQYSIKTCNVFGLDNELVARTDNPLESFNRKLNSRFPTPHPSMATFATLMKKMSQEYVRLVADVPQGPVGRITGEVMQLPDAFDIASDIESNVEEANTTDAGKVTIV